MCYWMREKKTIFTRITETEDILAAVCSAVIDIAYLRYTEIVTVLGSSDIISPI